MDDLTRRTIVGLAKFQLFLALVIFLPAWSLRFWQGWLYWLIFGAFCFVLGLHFVRHDPALVARRMEAGPRAEKEPRQKLILACATVTLIAVYVVSGLDHRFRWSLVPSWLVLIADLLVVVAAYGFYITFRENSYAASTVTVETGQPVISSGPYAAVRHPMYTASIILYVATPLALASWWGLVPAAVLAAVIVWRLIEEETYLAHSLAGYVDYRRRVRARLVPGVW
ncbi:MAG: isoprenylcysteine carboxylmethyltransferase family protein [Alphaproteobacteria bacterium]